MRYEDAVTEGRQLVKRSEEDQWRLAELTWEQCQDRSRSRAQWARDIGISERHARALYQVWDTYRDQWNRPGEPIPFTDAYATTKGYPSDPTERAEAQAVTRVHNMPIARKAEVARELLAEPEVAEKLAVDPTTTRALDEAFMRTRKVSEDKLRKALERVPESLRNESLGPPTGVTGQLMVIRDGLRGIHAMLVNPRIDWSGYGAAVGEELDQIGNQAKLLGELARDPSKATVTDEDLEQLLSEHS